MALQPVLGPTYWDLVAPDGYTDTSSWVGYRYEIAPGGSAIKLQLKTPFATGFRPTSARITLGFWGSGIIGGAYLKSTAGATLGSYSIYQPGGGNLTFTVPLTFGAADLLSLFIETNSGAMITLDYIYFDYPLPPDPPPPEFWTNTIGCIETV